MSNGYNLPMTDRARGILQMANNFARKEFNHEYIGTEHVLLALCNERFGVASTIIANHVNRDTLAVEIRSILDCGPEMVTIGKLPMTPRLRSAMDLALNEAVTMGDRYIGTEHLLLGLANTQDAYSSMVLANHGMSYDILKAEIYELLGKSEPKQPVNSTPSPAVVTHLPSGFTAISIPSEQPLPIEDVKKEANRLIALIVYCIDQGVAMRFTSHEGLNLAMYHLNQSHGWLAKFISQ